MLYISDKFHYQNQPQKSDISHLWLHEKVPTPPVIFKSFPPDLSPMYLDQ